MSRNETRLPQADILKPVELSSWALALFGLVIVNWLPTSPDSRRTITLLLLAFVLYLLVYFHWLWPRYKEIGWMKLVPAVANILIVTPINYILGSVVNVEIIYIVIVVNAAIRLGRRFAMVAAAFSALMIIGTDLIRETTPSDGMWLSSSLSIIVCLVAGYLAGSLADTIRRQAKEAQTLQRAVQRQAERISVVNEVARHIGSTIEMDTLLELIYQQLSRTIPTDTYYVGIHPPSRDDIELLIVYDEGKHFPTQRIPLGRGLASSVIQRREPLLVRRLSVEKETLKIQALTVGADRISESWLGVPMLMADGFTGLLVVASYKPDVFDADDLALLTNIAAQIALALDNARHHAQVEEQARRDSLTGVYNHGFMLKRLQEEVDWARANRRPVSLIMLDIDHFKKYNDTYGHLMGDQVLRLIVQAIQAHVKQSDVVGRWGGEEFGVVLTNATAEQSAGVAGRIRASLAALPLVDGAGHAIPKPTVSQGIATLSDQTADAIQLIDLADATLYQAKQLGRDRVLLANSSA